MSTWHYHTSDAAHSSATLVSPWLNLATSWSPTLIYPTRLCRSSSSFISSPERSSSCYTSGIYPFPSSQPEELSRSPTWPTGHVYPPSHPLVLLSALFRRLTSSPTSSPLPPPAIPASTTRSSAFPPEDTPHTVGARLLLATICGKEVVKMKVSTQDEKKHNSDGVLRVKTQISLLLSWKVKPFSLGINSRGPQLTSLVMWRKWLKSLRAIIGTGKTSRHTHYSWKHLYVDLPSVLLPVTSAKPERSGPKTPPVEQKAPFPACVFLHPSLSFAPAVFIHLSGFLSLSLPAHPSFSLFAAVDTTKLLLWH